jgi:Dyp-type peroxidase family
MDLPKIQGFVVRGYRLPWAAYLVLRVDERASAQHWVARIGPDVLTAAPWSSKPEAGVNVAFTHAGLEALGVPGEVLAQFPHEFRDGMASRAHLLGDTGESAPEHWERPFGTDEVHALVMISAQDEATLRQHEAVVRAGLTGLSVVGLQVGSALAGGTEHFGYADGFAQPEIEGVPDGRSPGGGAPAENGGWRPIRSGEFVLGYPDEQDAIPAAPPDPLSANGSYLVYRKLQQDVVGFRSLLKAAALHYPDGEAALSAKVVGRWKDGTPLASSPDRNAPALAADPARNNDFDYGDDPDGLRCPVGAHVRRANPRRSLPFEGLLVNRHRMVRRGIPYGAPLPEGAVEDGQDRGVVFMCLQASIARQFEFVQGQWLNGGNALGLGDDQDVLLGAQEGHAPLKMTVPGTPPCFVGPLKRVVTVRGGEYFFVPGVNGLSYLAALGE